MKPTIYIYLILFLIMTGGIQACKSTKHLSTGKKKEQTATYNPGTDAIFIEANKEKIINNYERAANLFAKVIEKDPKYAAAYFELGKIKANSNENEEAVELITKAIELSPENIWYQQILAGIYMDNNQQSEAIRIFKALAEKHPENLDFLYNWSMACIYAKDYEEAIKVYEKMEDIIGITEELTLQKEKLFLMMGKYEKAEEEIQKLIEAFPKETTYMGMLADLYIGMQKPEKAFKVYNKILEIEPQNPEVHLALSDYYRDKGEDEKAFESIKTAFESPSLNIDRKVEILLIYYDMAEYMPAIRSEAIDLGETLIKAHPDEPKAYSIYGDILLQNNKLEAAAAAFEKVVELDASKYIIWESLLMIYLDQQKPTLLASKSEETISLFPMQPLPYLLNGLANYQLHQYEASIAILKDGLKLIVNDARMESQFYSQLADVQNTSGDFKSAYMNYQKALDLDPDNPTLLNNFSYHLAQQEKDLDKAKKMILQALGYNPNSPSFLDTYAWVLFKSGEYSEAEKQLSNAISMGGNENAVIVEHLGDVYYHLGEKEKAVSQWQKAKELGRKSSILEKKLREQTYYE